MVRFINYSVVPIQLRINGWFFVLQVNSLPKEYSSRIKIQTIEGLGKPANLPFGLIMWAKKYIFRLNCLYNKFHGIPDPIIRGNKRSKTPLCSSLIDLHTNTSTQDNPPRRITHVYYTESDQLLRFMNSEVRDTIIGALNITSHLIGRRKEKNIKIPSGPTDYMGGLLPTRDVCGNKSLPFELSVHDSMVRPVPLGTTGWLCLMRVLHQWPLLSNYCLDL